MPTAIAVTGGIASGKSAVCEAFARLGRTVVDADIAAREVVAPGSSGLARVVEEFGPAMLTAAGELDRASLRARVFAEPEARRRLEAILHPLIRERLHQQALAAPAPYVLVAIPLLAEAREPYSWLSRVLVVDVPRSLQVSRVMQRDRIDRDQAMQILAVQATREARLRIATDVIVNDADFAQLDRMAQRLDQRWCRLSTPATD